MYNEITVTGGTLKCDGYLRKKKIEMMNYCVKGFFVNFEKKTGHNETGVLYDYGVQFISI